jgi:DNA-binding MarR family transcriptional regulator
MAKTRSSGHRNDEVTLDLPNYFPAIMTAVANQWSRESAALYLKEFNVTLVEWRLMALMAVEDWITASRVDAVIGMDKASVSRGVRLLEHRGLVETRPSALDPRRREMNLTPAGRALQSRIAKVASAREARMLDCLDARERATLIALLARVRENMARG